MNQMPTTDASNRQPISPTDRVIVGVDGSPTSDLAVDVAADEAACRDTTLEILHALEWVELASADDRYGRELRANAQAVADNAGRRARARHPELDVVVSVELGNAIDLLEAASDRAALLVVGSRGFGGFKGLLMGSVSLPVASIARCPLLVVHPDHVAVPEGEALPIVVGVSDDECTPALEAAFAQAHARGLPLHAVHTWSYPVMVVAAVPATPELWSVEDWEKTALALLAAAVAPLREKYPDVAVTEMVVLDTPAHALVDRSEQAAMVVLAAHRRTARFGRNLGRVTHTVLHHSKAPVLLVPVA